MIRASSFGSITSGRTGSRDAQVERRRQLQHQRARSQTRAHVPAAAGNGWLEDHYFQRNGTGRPPSHAKVNGTDPDSRSNGFPQAIVGAFDRLQNGVDLGRAWRDFSRGGAGGAPPPRVARRSPIKQDSLQSALQEIGGSTQQAVGRAPASKAAADATGAGSSTTAEKSSASNSSESHTDGSTASTSRSGNTTTSSNNHNNNDNKDGNNSNDNNSNGDTNSNDRDSSKSGIVGATLDLVGESSTNTAAKADTTTSTTSTSHHNSNDAKDCKSRNSTDITDASTTDANSIESSSTASNCMMNKEGTGSMKADDSAEVPARRRSSSWARPAATGGGYPSENSAVAEARAAVAAAGTFRDYREIWGKRAATGFAGQQSDLKSRLSRKEAEAALQRLATANSTNQDLDEVRRMRKLVNEMQ
eukprot:TRINITY_DN12093_c0_g1_i1.p1 TRINITY_DN12093_c0_g1~~TRINITY_DN12093_c0_g1_i1.p1  ORF type:complete len:417 (+),score=108.23 TRINITY_DN12093_c0_g1_i1:21-1271(+)